MSSAYQRQMGRKSKPNIYGPSGGSSNDTDDALARAEKARRIRAQRIANLRREDAALDAKFGFVDYTHASVVEMKDQLAKREKREKLARTMTGNGDSKDAVKKEIACESIEGGGGGGAESTLPGASGTRRGWVFNMVPTTLPPSANDDEAASPLESSGGFVGAGDEDGGGAEGSANERAGVELFLIDEEHRHFKATVVYEPYFYLIPEDKTSNNGGG
eukprot:CAMPEP_0183736688 /NCGR_PEP_ID=MMETSP0737-20130205/49979_1 /TAXON_ID=385413 /ORGANISM="Thalassiosira miniscula, Strain CCMP1093" /LENGTH=216 /DNA_ID=CAMNT_0025970759 /DNA_START=39 /DNA_END=686 /DNA_ORIENTATION=-